MALCCAHASTLGYGVVADMCSVRHPFLALEAPANQSSSCHVLQIQRTRRPTYALEHPTSPGGWWDLPSDAEDTFFSASEVEDYRRDDRRRVIDRYRETRSQALRAEAGDSDEAQNGAEVTRK